MLYAEWFFIEGEVCQLNGELQVDICTKEYFAKTLIKDLQ